MKGETIEEDVPFVLFFSVKTCMALCVVLFLFFFVFF